MKSAEADRLASFCANGHISAGYYFVFTLHFKFFIDASRLRFDVVGLDPLGFEKRDHFVSATFKCNICSGAIRALALDGGRPLDKVRGDAFLGRSGNTDVVFFRLLADIAPGIRGDEGRTNHTQR